MGLEIGIAAIKALVVLLIVLHLTVFMLWVERKGSALIQNRIGANRAAIFGVLPWNTGIVTTLMADPVKMFTKEDFVPEGADRLLHFIAPFLCVFPIFVTFACVPFGDELRIGERSISLQVADLNVGVLYILAAASIAVYGVVLAGWASNNRWAMLGGLRGSNDLIRGRDGARNRFDGDGVRDARPTGDGARAGRGPRLVSRIRPSRPRLAARLGYLLPAARVPDFLCRGHRGEQANSLRSAGERVGADQRLLHRILGRQAGDVHVLGLRRNGAGLGARHDDVLRRLADSVPHPQRLRVPMGRALGTAASVDRRRASRGVSRQSALLQLVPDPHP